MRLTWKQEGGSIGMWYPRGYDLRQSGKIIARVRPCDRHEGGGWYWYGFGLNTSHRPVPTIEVAMGKASEPKNCAMRHRKRPCADCPWRKDVAPGQFAGERYEQLRSTTGRSTSGRRGEEAPMGSPLFACHKSKVGAEIPCAGW